MSSFKVTPDQLESTASSLAKAKAKSEVESQLASVRTQVGNVASVWEGSAQTQFTGLMDRWQKASKDLADTLGTIHHNLTAAGGSYRAAGDASAKGFQE